VLERNPETISPDPLPGYAWLDAGGKVLHVEAARLEFRMARCWCASRQPVESGVDNTICYLNTDLDLTSAEDPTALAAAFEIGSIPPLHVTHAADGRWYATFETSAQFAEPEANIAAMLDVVESLARPLRSVWDACTRREFNIGYECGAEPWAFNQGLPAELLGRMAAVGASMRVTLYPGREPATPD
jgi:hypothetical protein